MTGIEARLAAQRCLDAASQVVEDGAMITFDLSLGLRNLQPDKSICLMCRSCRWAGSRKFTCFPPLASPRHTTRRRPLPLAHASTHFASDQLHAGQASHTNDREGQRSGSRAATVHTAHCTLHIALHTACRPWEAATRRQSRRRITQTLQTVG